MMRFSWSTVAARAAAVCLLAEFLAPGAAAQDAAGRSNLGGGLGPLVNWYKNNGGTKGNRKARFAADHPRAVRASVNEAVTEALVDVRLDGKQPVATVRTALAALGARVLAVHEIAGPGSIISAYVPLRSVEEAAKLPGVFSMTLAQKPRRRVGATVTQGAALLKTPALNAMNPSLTGKNIVVGIISDSYNVAPNVLTAEDDIESGDLPGPGNTLGHTQAVQILAEGDPSTATDEGRAMAQIIHDIAPDAKLVFASSGLTQAMFAQRIRALRTQANCDIIVDDIGFADEPFFSDGIVSQAVEDVVRSDTLPGRKVKYYSAAGNDGDLAYASDFRFIPEADVRGRVVVRSNLKLGAVPRYLTLGGFHNFATSGNPVVVQTIKVTGAPAEICLQWDDPFVPGLVTTDFNVLVFDINGNYRFFLSGIDDNINLGQAVDFAFLPPGRYQIAISRRITGSQQATHLRYVVNSDGGFEANFLPPNAPAIFGHPAAPGADGVGAYDAARPTVPESFSSFGPLTIYFDRNGQRLGAPEVRQQPTISAPDGVNTTFFPAGSLLFTDTDEVADDFPNFFGTSAAAPHAAAVAALLLEKAGGNDSLTELEMREALQKSVVSHDLDPSNAKAVVKTADNLSTATLTAVGNDSNNSSFDKKFFTLTFAGPGTRILKQVKIDLAPAGLRFDPSLAVGLPFKLGAFSGLAAAHVKPTFVGARKTGLTLNFTGLATNANAAFNPGDSISFGVDRDLTAGFGGNSADFLQGATVSITTAETGATQTGSDVFMNVVGQGFSPADGFGLIDAQNALNFLPP